MKCWFNTYQVYNNERIKQKLNWQSPVQFRKTAVTAA
ncbi:IS3 family transposase [Enterococcus sp. 2CBP]